MTVELTRPVSRRLLGTETLLVLGLSLGQSAVYAVVSIIAKLTADGPLSKQTASLNTSASARPWLDLTYQLLGIVFALLPVLLAVHLLSRDPGDPARTLGLDARRPGQDLARGAGLAALIGLPGLALFWVAAQLGLNATLVPAALPDVWWAVPVLILAAVQNAVLEEVIVVGYLVTRLRQLQWRLGRGHRGQRPAARLVPPLPGLRRVRRQRGDGRGVRLFYLRTRRVMPLIIAHTLLDVVAFVGYALLPREWFDWL